MLTGISPLLSPELLMIIAEMGHGDELVIGDGNFPAAAMAQRLVRADGHRVKPLLEAILQLFPLDRFVEKPVGLMAVVPGDRTVPTIWEEYRSVVQQLQPERIAGGFEMVERFAFYERTKEAYAVVATGETELYANIILKKGVVDPAAK
ncbi:MAG: L-fucose mutarotase [Spirochaetaceae bacterium]|nr:MAG: L-fucose mutarotase [Spirochaetaceae bacterium]